MAGLVVLGLIVLAALYLTLEPLRRGQVADPDAAQRDDLMAERDRLYMELADPAAGDRRPDLERRAARTLRALDALPPAPGRGGARRLALIGTVAALLVTAIAAFTVVPRWQLASLDTGEAANVQAVLDLPQLRATAERTKTNTDYLAWGKAAFDSGTYDQALTAYGNALKLDPRQPVALRRLGILLLTRGEQTGQEISEQDATQAALLVQTAAQLAPSDPESQLLLGYTLARFGQSRDALDALERYRTLSPSGREADELITALRTRLQQSDPALTVYAANCASCHGPAGGGGIGPNLRVSTLTRAAMATIIRQGKGAMPAYPQLSGRDLTLLLTLLEDWQKAGQ
ncbi:MULTISPECIES: c-type cytochrome [Deinococcus]|uniref:C-type cytochrome n=1 Tax=Deinococcus rufus TaxID=2136097 RepID=A0ABV7ZEC7_9DEIO|nr:c-type cytochrome [Deinococcus sp. AB2017081]WQE94175.1 c-type cytochrome [Deinococcus sp. AB2017081]